MNLVVAEAVAFWAALLWLMAAWANEFRLGVKEYNKSIKRDGVIYTNSMMWILGFISMGLPVIKAGIWLHYSAIVAWSVLGGQFVLTLLLMYLASKSSEHQDLPKVA